MHLIFIETLLSNFSKSWSTQVNFSLGEKLSAWSEPNVQRASSPSLDVYQKQCEVASASIEPTELIFLLLMWNGGLRRN